MAVAEAFATYFGSQGVEISELRLGDASRGEPDILGKVGGAQRGIEVIDVWYSKADAHSAMELVRKLERSSERGHAGGAGFEQAHYEHPSGDPFIGSVQATLDDHGLKQYAEPTWLLLNAAGTRAPFHDAADGPRVVAALHKPARFSYLDAFLLLSGEGRAQFFRVP